MMKLARLLIVAMLTLAVVVAGAVATANGIGLQQETAATAAAQDPEAAGASLQLNRPAQRLIQQGLRNEGFDPGTPDGLFGPRTRAAIRDWQQPRGTSPTGNLNRAEAEFLRTAAAPPPASEASPPPQAVPAVASVLSAAATPASTAAETDSNPARQPTVASELDPQNATATNAEHESRAATGSGNAQLPPEIMVDRHLLRAERRRAADDPAAALEAMNEILALQEEHDLVLPDDFNFQYAEVGLCGRPDRDGHRVLEPVPDWRRPGAQFYRQALELLDSAGVSLTREEADRQRADVERRRAARWPPGTVFRDCEACPEVVVLPGSRLALGRYEVTFGEYRALASATGGATAGGCRTFREDADSWRNPGFPQTDRHPVTCVSLDDAQAYLSWLSRTSGVAYRLPTSAELVRAAEGSQPGCYRDRTDRDGTCPVGTYGSNRMGLSDMPGNVWEWASDCWDGDCGRRVAHGNGWAAPTRFLVPNWFGSTTGPDSRGNGTGFRVARALDQRAHRS